MRKEAEWRGGRGEGGGQKCVVRSFHYLCIGSASLERFFERYDSISLHFFSIKMSTADNSSLH